MTDEQFLKAKNCETREVYHSSNRLGYACWVSFFPGESGRWYITFEEVSHPDKPLQKMSRDKWYSFSVPLGYDKSEYLMEMVIVESVDGMKTWNVISREPCRFQHSAGSFGQARTKDGRFIRFVWAAYSLDDDIKPNEIFYASSDNGKTWQKQAPLFDSRFVSYAHRLRTLRDGTLVLALPMCPAFSVERPRAAKNLNTVSETLMHLVFSSDQGRTWSQPLPILGDQGVGETDFVELPSGDLLFIASSMWPRPGRQVIYRTEKGFIPGAFESVTSTYDFVPETVCITEDGLLVGCHRSTFSNTQYAFSDDGGLSWLPIKGPMENMGRIYQPWIQYLGNGSFACAGHVGGDEPISGRDNDRDQCVMLHLFEIEVLKKTKATDLKVFRDFDKETGRYKNEYTLVLTCDGVPVAGKEIEFWYAERDKPGYDTWGRHTLEERMKMGGELIRVQTGDDGKAHVKLSQFDKIDYIHHCIKLVASFNTDGKYNEYKPARSLQYQFYSVMYQDPPLVHR
ncbi:MAG: exo-alpha-sialidase [Ruminiclostridium sp.]|nr:exo-alpha-sialidase [Ruminiclostridium sp.]